MSEQSQARASDLKQMANKFGALSHAENLLLESCATGKASVCGSTDDDQDESNNPKNADNWGDNRRIRAELIAWLCQEEQTRKHIHPHGIRVYGADVIGRLDLSYFNIPFPLTLQHCRFKKGIELNEAEVLDLDFDGSLVYGFSADSVIVKQYVSMANGFTAIGEVNIVGAQIGRNLECQDGTFTNEGGIVIRADGIRVGDNIFLRHGFTAKGEVRLLGAQIGGDLDCEAGSFTNEGHTALNADGISVNESVFLRRGEDLQGKVRRFSAKGEVNLALAQIDGQIQCRGGEFINPGGFAIRAFRAVVKSSLVLDDGFEAEGKVDLAGTQISGSFHCTNGAFAKATLDLTDACVGTLIDSGLDDPVDSDPTVWPEKGKLFLDGFVYGRISSEGRINVERRITHWLALQPESPFRPQPYLQLAKILRESGDSAGAKRVLIEMEDQLRRGDFWASVERPILRFTIGYGYDPIRAFWWVAGLSGLGWIIYRRSYLAGGIVPTEKDACADFRKAERKVPAQYPSFSPLIYSVENSLPLVKLGQGDKWQPDPEPDHRAAHQVSPAIGQRGTWARRSEGLQKSTTEANSNPAPPAVGQTIPSSPIGTVISTGSLTAAVGPALASDKKEREPAAISVVQRMLCSLGLKPALENTGKPSLLRHFGTSPRFIKWFLWIQILLGWLLATLFVAGVSGIVRKE